MFCYFILGDVSIHVDVSNATSGLFMDAFQTFNLQRHVSFAIHIHGHWLALFITRLNCNNIKSVIVVDGLSDHHAVIIVFWSKLLSEPSKQCVTFRPINKN